MRSIIILIILLFVSPCHGGDTFLMAINDSSDILQILIPATALGTTFYLDDKEGTSQFFKSFITNFGVVFSLKNIIDKKRPDGSDGSFPSGHTASAFQGASFIHKRYGLKYAALPYFGATLVGYSRIKTNNHYIEDVLAGTIIGTISSFYFTEKYGITPIINNNTYGINLNLRW